MTYYKDMKVIYKTHDRLMNETIAAFLEAQGIKTIVDQDAAGSIFGFTIGRIGEVNILVHESQVDEAIALIKAMEAGEFEDLQLLDNQNDEDDPKA